MRYSFKYSNPGSSLKIMEGFREAELAAQTLKWMLGQLEELFSAEKLDFIQLRAQCGVLPLYVHAFEEAFKSGVNKAKILEAAANDPTAAAGSIQLNLWP